MTLKKTAIMLCAAFFGVLFMGGWSGDRSPIFIKTETLAELPKNSVGNNRANKDTGKYKLPITIEFYFPENDNYGFRVGSLIDVVLIVKHRPSIKVSFDFLPRSGERIAERNPCVLWNGTENPVFTKTSTKNEIRHKIHFTLQCFLVPPAMVMFPSYPIRYTDTITGKTDTIMSPQGPGFFFTIERTAPVVFGGAASPLPLRKADITIHEKLKFIFWSCGFVLFLMGIYLWRKNTNMRRDAAKSAARYSLLRKILEEALEIYEEKGVFRQGLVESIVRICTSERIVPSAHREFIMNILDGKIGTAEEYKVLLKDIYSAITLTARKKRS